MRVHEEKWRKDAQLEWPEPASETQWVAASGEARRKSTTQSFPDTGRTGVPRGDFAGPGRQDHAGPGRGNLAGPGRARFADPDRTQAPTDGTEVLAGGRTGLTGPDRAAVPRDPWEPVGEAAHTHDPHEVTVQLDAVSLHDTRLRTAAGEPGGGSENSDGPVFVDASGRRSRRFRRLGMALALACAVYAVVIVATLLSGSSDAPWLPVPGQEDEKPAGQVEPSSRPADSAVPSGTGGLPAGATPRAGDGSTPSPGASGALPAATAGPAKPGASTAPAPKPSTSTVKPTSGLADPKPSATAGSTKPAAPDPTPTESTVAPTQTPVDGSSGGNAPVANGAGSPPPVAEDQAAPPASSVPSPEITL
ncbi:hypothetical protein [Streptomyces sediminimaris]|uniref:hypothetical protein n=1 Tax=Streptomyces sediminimaris TaxID=3383721 RepID=UPI0039995907